jgi:hypothetical protein
MNKVPTVPIGAIELIREVEELLASKRASLTSVAEYTAQRRHYWQAQSTRAPRRPRAALPRRSF